MGDPLAFPFHDDEHEHESGSQRNDRFRAAHPRAQYLVLDVDDDDLPMVLADAAAAPDSPWLTPVQENPVNAQVVAVLDQWPPAAGPDLYSDTRGMSADQLRWLLLREREHAARLRQENDQLRALRTRGGPAPADTTDGWRNGASSQPATAHLPQNEVTA